MLYPLFSNAAVAASDFHAASAAIKCLLAYTHGLKDCRIDVEIVDGNIMLSGIVSSEDAIGKAVAIASDFMRGQVHCRLQATVPQRLG